MCKIKYEEIDRILDFILISKHKLYENYISDETMIVCMPEYFFNFLSNRNNSLLGKSNAVLKIEESFVCGIKIQPHFENKVVVFYNAYYLKDIIKFETDINLL